jgi:hypothetical protein
MLAVAISATVNSEAANASIRIRFAATEGRPLEALHSRRETTTERIAQ